MPETRIDKGFQGGTSDPKGDVLLLDLKAAAVSMSLSYWTLRDMCLRGELPFLRCGRKWLIDRRDLLEWIEKHKQIGV